MRSPSIPCGWEFWTVGDPGYAEGFDSMWKLAAELKLRREELRPDVLVRVSVVWPQRGGVWWIIRKEEKRETAT